MATYFTASLVMPNKNSARVAAWRAANPEKNRAQRTAYVAATREKRYAYDLAWRAANPDKHNATRLKTQLKERGITPAEYAVMSAAQNGVCAICKKPPGGRRRRLCVDHKHGTDIVRGLLCDKCNWAIGLLADDPTVVLSAHAYLCIAEGREGAIGSC